MTDVPITSAELSSFLSGGRVSEARITNPANFGYRVSVSIPVHARLNTDVSGQVGLGVSEAND